MYKTVAMALALVYIAFGQTLIDLRTQTKSVDFSGATLTKPIQTGTATPSACSTGQMYFNSNTTAGQNLYGCVATNTWMQESGVPGITGVTVQTGAATVGTRPIFDFSAGLGALLSINDTGQAISIQQGADLAVMQTRANEQTGSGLYCLSASGSASSYTCSLSPALTIYTVGMVLRWQPDVNGGGGPTTLNVDTLGSISIKLADGLTDPAPGNIVAGQIQELWYDGTNFRFLNGAAAGGGGVTVQNGGVTVGTRPTLNFSAGLGSLLTISDTGQAISIQPGADLAAMQTRAADQSGSALLCASASGSTSIYTCSLSPTLTSYTTGMVLRWDPDLSGAGGPTTLNVDTLGATSLKLADGATDPAPGDIVAGRIREIWYDGAAFRLINDIVPAGVLGDAIPPCNAATRGRMWFVAGTTGVKDSLSVCAKDSTNTFAWRALY